MIQPPKEMFDLFVASATRFGVPLTLLEALAFDASRFDPHTTTVAKPGEAPRKGLFGFTDENVAALSIADPYDPSHATDAAARVLAAMQQALPDTAMQIAAWHLGTVQDVAHLVGVTPESWPTDLRRYVEKIVRIRYFYQDLGSPRGADTVEHLANAINALADANLAGASSRANELIGAARDAMMTYKTGLLPMRTLKSVWEAYRMAFEVAPITTAYTPIPERIEPDWWREQTVMWTPTLGGLATKVDNAASAVVEKLDHAFLFALGGAVILGAFWIAVNRSSH